LLIGSEMVAMAQHQRQQTTILGSALVGPAYQLRPRVLAKPRTV
jgi:hypothetical protein